MAVSADAYVCRRTLSAQCTAGETTRSGSISPTSTSPSTVFSRIAHILQSEADIEQRGEYNTQRDVAVSASKDERMSLSCTGVCLRVCVCMYIFMYICTYYTYVYTYIHIYI